MSSSECVLCVDDEPEVLRGLTLHLAKCYRVLTATSGATALVLLQHDPDIAVIISDMLMPGQSGATFLEQSRALAPDAQRIMLTGQTDLASAIAAVNLGQVFRFLTKPCPPPELMATVRAAMELYELHALERTVLRRKVEHGQLRVDALTGLASRLQVTEILEAAAAAATEAASAVAAYFIDVGRWDEPGGHDDAEADSVPQTLATRLRQYCTGAAVVAHWGIGQFVVILPSHGVADLDLYVWGEQLLRALAEPIVLNKDRIALSVSVGIARLVDRLQWQRLIQSAGMAARQARREREPRVCLYRSEIPLQAERERNLLRALRETLDLEGLHLHYQPIVDVNAGRVRTVECLARWHHERLGDILPATFIGLAEQHGEIVRLGQWVLLRALGEAAQFMTDGRPSLSVNVSAHQLMDRDFVSHLAKRVALSAMPPGALELELTESALAADMENLSDVLKQIRRLKVRIAVDDFGTGYSSLSYLSRLPIDVIKVDRVFVRDFNRGGKTIIKAALTIACDFGQEVVIEGVETAEMLAQVRELGATLIQGYWFAKPMAAAEVSEWKREFEHRTVTVQDVPTYP